MKGGSFIAVFVFLAGGMARGVTIVNLYDFSLPDTGLHITDADGVVLESVNISVGTYTGSFKTTDEVKLNFVELAFGSAEIEPRTQFFVNQNDNDFVVVNSPEDDSQIYIVLYQSATLAEASEAILLELPQVFYKENELFGAVIAADLGKSEVLFGRSTIADTSGVIAPFINLTRGVTFAVPEPSSLALSVLGLGLCFRRNRIQ